ncbi:membrane magnesium transporter-domain-containing protein [Cyathus striatus]|nr:membrane magnesium transporter-domain-containing protein [Cyathus striatus]
MLGRILLILLSLRSSMDSSDARRFLTAAFSTYEHLSHLKALERPEGSLPRDIIFETLIALAIGILGASLSTPPLKEITWASEMQKHKIDEMDSRLGFASYVNRGSKLLAQSAPVPSYEKVLA